MRNGKGIDGKSVRWITGHTPRPSTKRPPRISDSKAFDDKVNAIE